jgi:hypothetical protein
VDVGFEKPDARPLLSAFDVDGLELDSLKSKEKTGVTTLRLEQVHDLAVRHSPGLRDRVGEDVKAAVQE